ncbi:MAG TPA: serine hydrolase [Pyrinomonadaceae bacterium]|nr:serine hydrolase [Pyrinomonadaceae bacterium]
MMVPRVDNYVRVSMIQLLFVLLFSTVALSQAQVTEQRLTELQEYAEKARKDWNVPGFSIAVVKDDKVIFAKGFGIRELGKPGVVDENTLFAIASNSKAFTAAALAVLVDEGKVKWDDRVTKYLPSFELYDPYVTRELTIRDLLSHRSGLETFAGDLLWYESNYTRDEILSRARFLKPASSFRSRFGYQNILYMAAGEIVGKVSGLGWDGFVKERFFAPLGMKRTVTTHAELLKADNVATPHNSTEGNIRVIRYGNLDNMAPAGGIKSSALDMAQWMRLQLGRGSFETKKLFGANRSREMWTPHTVFTGISEDAEKFNPTRHFNLYGLGWLLSDYHGRLVVSHGGGLDGMTSQLTLLPEEKLGVVVLTNSESPLGSIVVNRVVDMFLGVPPRDWSADFRARSKASEEAAKVAAKKLEDARVLNTKPSLPLAAYAGTYSGQMFGDAKVTEENGGLVVRLMPSSFFIGDLEHWNYDTFRIKWRDSVVYPFPRGFVTFTLSRDAKPREMIIDVPNPDFDFKELEFKRVP